MLCTLLQYRSSHCPAPSLGPAVTHPVTDTHRLPVPGSPPARHTLFASAAGLLVKTLYLSTDPYLRCRFNADTGVPYTQPFCVGKPICSAGIGLVLHSDVPGYCPGDLVLEGFDSWPWQVLHWRGCGPGRGWRSDRGHRGGEK